MENNPPNGQIIVEVLLIFIAFVILYLTIIFFLQEAYKKQRFFFNSFNLIKKIDNQKIIISEPKYFINFHSNIVKKYNHQRGKKNVCKIFY